MPGFPSPTIGCTETNVKFSVMMPYRSCPRPIQIKIATLHIIFRILIITIQSISCHFPVYQIFRYSNRASRHIVHTGRHEIKLIINPDQIRIGPVSPHDRVRKCSILIIRIPNLLCPQRKETHSTKTTY